jgi:hypothetical protein
MTCGLVLIYTLLHHVASNGSSSHAGDSKAATSDEKVKHFKSKFNINITYFLAEFSIHTYLSLHAWYACFKCISFLGTSVYIDFFIIYFFQNSHKK